MRPKRFFTGRVQLGKFVDIVCKFLKAKNFLKVRAPGLSRGVTCLLDLKERESGLEFETGRPLQSFLLFSSRRLDCGIKAFS